jgi:hypothetical protein
MSEQSIDWKNEELVQNQKNMYHQIITNIREPPAEKKKFASENNQRLGLVIIEPRSHEWLKGVLYNMAHIYGNTDTVLYIVHGNDNEEFVKSIIDDSWSNVILLKIPVSNLTRDDYNLLLTNGQFWKYFKTEYVLIFQSDTFIRKQISDLFFLYDYVGAPWYWKPNGIQRSVGNGGFSLRKTSVMKDICNKYKFDKETEEGEDVYFCRYVEVDYVPPPNLASIFAVEHIFYSDSIGLHQVWRFIKIEEIIKLMSDTGGVPHLNLNLT